MNPLCLLKNSCELCWMQSWAPVAIQLHGTRESGFTKSLPSLRRKHKRQLCQRLVLCPPWKEVLCRSHFWYFIFTGLSKVKNCTISGNIHKISRTTITEKAFLQKTSQLIWYFLFMFFGFWLQLPQRIAFLCETEVLYFSDFLCANSLFSRNSFLFVSVC